MDEDVNPFKPPTVVSGHEQGEFNGLLLVKKTRRGHLWMILFSGICATFVGLDWGWWKILLITIFVPCFQFVVISVWTWKLARLRQFEIPNDRLESRFIRSKSLGSLLHAIFIGAPASYLFLFTTCTGTLSGSGNDSPLYRPQGDYDFELVPFLVTLIFVWCGGLLFQYFASKFYANRFGLEQ